MTKRRWTTALLTVGIGIIVMPLVAQLAAGVWLLSGLIPRPTSHGWCTKFAGTSCTRLPRGFLERELETSLPDDARIERSTYSSFIDSVTAATVIVPAGSAAAFEGQLVASRYGQADLRACTELAGRGADLRCTTYPECHSQQYYDWTRAYAPDGSLVVHLRKCFDF